MPPQVAVGKPTAFVTDRKRSDGSVSFDFRHSGKDPITSEPLIPSLNLHSSLSFAENLKNGTLTITGSFTGDKFPSTEAFITDQSGQTQLFLGSL